ncbi:winged helix-turn-helix domain-containing protein [Klebsiella aerogenes]
MYFINKSFYFDSDKMVLINKEKNKSSKLYSTTSSLLLLLIKMHGEVLSKEFVLKNIWLDLDIVVTEGSYYQAITHLRKKIRELDCSIDFIQTIPRRGIVIPRSVEISIVTDGIEIRQTQASLESGEIREVRELQESQDLQAAQRVETLQKYEELQKSETYQKEEGVNEEEELTQTKNSLRAQDIAEYSRSKKKPFFVLFVFLFSFLLVFLIFRQKHSSNNEWKFDAYKEYKTGEKCHVFLNDANNATGIDNIVNKSCDGDKYIYITRFKCIKRVSVFICDEKLEGKNDNFCVSTYEIIK